MPLTYSQWIWGFEVFDTTISGVQQQNNKLDIRRPPTTGVDFDATATLNVGVYTADEFATEVARAMNAADNIGGVPQNNYVVSFSVSTLKFQISGTNAFDLRVSDGPSPSNTECSGLLGLNTSSNKTFTPGNPILSDSAIGGTYSTARLWTMSEPLVMTSPVSAQALPQPSKLTQRQVRTIQHVSDGGTIESLHLSTLKSVQVAFRALTTTEQTNMEDFLDWAGTGKRLTWQPDKTSPNLLKLVLANRGQIGSQFEWLTRSETGYGTLTFYEQINP